jgi:phosphosulfolactate phosphohydrolase-like enzyme
MITGIAPVNRLLLPQQFNSDLELRQAAAAMHCDMLLIYTLDTTFTVEDAAVPLSVITLGLSPNEIAHVACTASAVIMDTRNGYVYGVAEATERQIQLASAWTSEAAVDQTRRRTEAKAFEKLTTELQGAWAGVVRQMTSQPAARSEIQ